MDLADLVLWFLKIRDIFTSEDGENITHENEELFRVIRVLDRIDEGGSTYEEELVGFVRDRYRATKVREFNTSNFICIPLAGVAKLFLTNGAEKSSQEGAFPSVFQYCAGKDAHFKILVLEGNFLKDPQSDDKYYLDSGSLRIEYLDSTIKIEVEGAMILINPTFEGLDQAVMAVDSIRSMQ
jgi:hypothetical protein